MGNQQVNVIRHRSSAQEDATAIRNDSTNVTMEIVTELIGNERFAILRGDHEMNQNRGEGLRHEKKMLDQTRGIKSPLPAPFQ